MADSESARTPDTARLTPYELAFSDAAFEERIFPDLDEEAHARGVDPAHREGFVLLEAAGRAVRGVVPDEAPAEAMDQYRALLFQAYNFRRAGKKLYSLAPSFARYLVEAAPSLTGWEFRTPHPSVYLQLPRHLFWSRVTPGATPEPVDGLFASAVTAEDPLGPAYRRLEVLMVLGMRPDRAGFSVVPFDTEIGTGIPAVWAEAKGRTEGREFENVLPGGEMSNLYSISTTTEATKLLARALWYVDTHPDDVTAERPSPATGPGASPARLPPTRLPYHRIMLRTDADAREDG